MNGDKAGAAIIGGMLPNHCAMWLSEVALYMALLASYPCKGSASLMVAMSAVFVSLC